eukprot:scaffold4270_cov166-Amphora_coffeaeformis.AAC.2
MAAIRQEFEAFGAFARALAAFREHFQVASSILLQRPATFVVARQSRTHLVHRYSSSSVRQDDKVIALS